ncbi:hypothetical protein [Fluviibacter phosphoraccumulans]|uniref:hypothetical protein n=1 Tax=Fluviibacter phosphoraccumulans TaxID=1751046 RepID=UPI001B3C9ECA|nr:hypothetical protein [Fluviibacter phosphoraccumulans]
MENKPMVSSLRILFGVLSFALPATSPVYAQPPETIVQSLVAQYAALPNVERIAFLQTIALIGLQPSALAKQSSPTITSGYTGTETRRTVPIDFDLTAPSIDAQSRGDITPVVAILNPITIADESLVETKAEAMVQEHSSDPKSNDQIRVVEKTKLENRTSQSRALDDSVFFLLLDDYNQKIADPLQKIQAHDLRNESINFYIHLIREQLGKCGYDVLSDQTPPEESANQLELETNLTRIAVNKTLLETAVTGEAAAKLSLLRAEQGRLEERSVTARAAQSISGAGDTSARTNEIKSALEIIISQLSNQIAEKICSMR